MASLASKLTLGATTVFTCGTIWLVTRMQTIEDQTMLKGLQKEMARHKEKQLQRASRQQELDEQVQRRHYLESLQPVSDPARPAPPLPPGAKIEPVDLNACATCNVEQRLV